MSDAFIARLDEHQERLDDHEKRLKMHSDQIAAHEERFDANEIAMFGGFDLDAKSHHVGIIEQLRVEMKAAGDSVKTGVAYIGTIKKTFVYAYRGLVTLVSAVTVVTTTLLFWCAHHLPQIIHFIKSL